MQNWQKKLAFTLSVELKVWSHVFETKIVSILNQQEQGKTFFSVAYQVFVKILS